MADKLLRHPVPYMNESITNYILRLCYENSCEVNQISDLIGFKFRSIGHYYRKLKNENKTKLSELTGIDIQVIEDMTTNKFSFSINSDFSCGTEASVCPKCYSERSYERIHWKNNLIKVCMDHEIYLVDECPNCKKKITSNIIFNGKCDCGLLIIEFKFAKCVNEYVLHNQNILYQIFNIKREVSLEEDLLFNTLSSEDYCNLLDHLKYLATIYAKELTELEIFLENDGRFKSNLIASWIMFDWPANIISFLNILNCLDIKYINMSQLEINDEWLFNYHTIDLIYDRFQRIFNPLECLRLNRIYYLVFRNKEIYQPIMNYFYENSNKENVKMKMDKFLYFNKYVELDMAFKIFFNINDSNNHLKKYVTKYFRVYRINNKDCLDLEEILNFYNEIKKNCSILLSNIEEISEYPTYTSFPDFFKYYDITLGDIIQVLLNTKLKVRFHTKYIEGYKSIYFPLELTKREFLLQLASRFDVTDHLSERIFDTFRI